MHASGLRFCGVGFFGSKILDQKNWFKFFGSKLLDQKNWFKFFDQKNMEFTCGTRTAECTENKILMVQDAP